MKVLKKNISIVILISKIQAKTLGGDKTSACKVIYAFQHQTLGANLEIL